MDRMNMDKSRVLSQELDDAARNIRGQKMNDSINGDNSRHFKSLDSQDSKRSGVASIMLQQKQMVQSRVMNNGFKLYPSNKKQFQAFDGFQPEPSPRGGDMISASGKGGQDISRGVATSAHVLSD